MTFGSQPQLDGQFSVSQLDLDQVLSLPQEIRTKPLAVIAKLTDIFSGAPALPLPVKLGLSVDALTLAGGIIQRVRSELRTDGNIWHIDTLDLRAPGLTQVRLSGSFDPKPGEPTFKGNATIEFRRSAGAYSVAGQEDRSTDDGSRFISRERRSVVEQRNHRA